MLKVQEIRELIKLVDESTISEFTYETNDTTVSMKKTGVTSEMKKVSDVLAKEEQPEVRTQTEHAGPKIEPAAEPIKVMDEKEQKQDSKDYDHEIISPMVGTLYRSSSPESDPYVQNGSSVKKDSVVCIVEAMKLFNEIEAEVTGEIVDVLVEDGELVEYGQPLFRVKTK